MNLKTKLFRSFFIYSFAIILIVSVMLMSFFSRKNFKIKNEYLNSLNILVTTEVENFITNIQHLSQNFIESGDLENIQSGDSVSKLLTEKYLTKNSTSIIESNPYIKEIRIIKGDDILFSTNNKQIIIIDETKPITYLHNSLYRTLSFDTNIDDTRILFIVSIEDFLLTYNSLIHEHKHKHKTTYVIANRWAISFPDKKNHTISFVEPISDTKLQINGEIFLYPKIRMNHLIQIVYPLDLFYADLKVTAMSVMMLLLLIGVVLFIITKRTSQTLTAPISRLATFSGSVHKSEGEHFKCKGKPIEEVQALILSFNDMIDEVKDITGKLESEVTRRTMLVDDQRKTVEQLNQELEFMSNKDRLTGLFNRKRFDADTSRDFEITVQANFFVGIAIIDIDLFKNINDTYGHSCGDKILVEISDEIKTVYNGNYSTICRYGGDEFIVWEVYEDNKRDHFVAMAEELRHNVENKNYKCKDSSVEVNTTISTGIFFNSVGDKNNINEILKIADNMLLEAKKQGRNSVKVN